MNRRRLVTVLLVLGVVALFAVPLALNGGRSDYAGTDNQATAVIQQQDPDYRPWFESVVTPASPSVESGLFALQAALGGGVLGYVIGRLRGRRLEQERAAEKHEDVAPVSSLAVDDAAWASAWRRHSPGDKALLSLGLVVCALVLPAWPGSVLVGLTAVVLALGPARVPARTFGRAIRWPMTFVAVGALTTVVEWGAGGIGWAPHAAVRAGSLVGHALAGGAAVLLLATTTPVSDLLPALRRARVPAAVVEVASVVYRLLSVLLDSLHTIREAQTARMGYSSLRRSYRSSGTLAAAVLIRSWDRARRMQDGLAGRGLETGLRVLPETRPSSAAFLAATGAGIAGIVVTSLVLA